MAVRLDVDDDDFVIRARSLIDARSTFRIRVRGWKATLLAPLLPKTGASLGITGVEIAGIVALAALATFAGVMVYAIRKGCPVTGKVKTGQASEIEITVGRSTAPVTDA